VARGPKDQSQPGPRLPARTWRDHVPGPAPRGTFWVDERRRSPLRIRVSLPGQRPRGSVWLLREHGAHVEEVRQPSEVIGTQEGAQSVRELAPTASSSRKRELPLCLLLHCGQTRVVIGDLPQMC
jgi:hypothetical protein